MVRVRQLVYAASQRLLFVPMLYVGAAVVLWRVMATLDGRIDATQLPASITVTLEGGRATLTALASGLITSVTLLLSLMLVAVQLASSNFSPRTLHDWTGDRSQQNTIGLVLGTAVFCLLVLRETSISDEDSTQAPHLSVSLAVVLAIVSLTAVVWYVDHLTSTLRVGSIARTITSQTVNLVRQRGERLEDELAGSSIANVVAASDRPTPPDNAVPVVSRQGGWIQQIDEDRLMAAMPNGSTGYLTAEIGSHLLPGQPFLYVVSEGDESDWLEAVGDSVAVGSERTMQDDFGYGITKLVDVALRALSPGINDPNTAQEIVVGVGTVLLAFWSYSEQPTHRTADGRSLVRQHLRHADVLEGAIGPIRRCGADDPLVIVALLRMLGSLESEVRRRDLPGPIEPLSAQRQHTFDVFIATEPSEFDRARVADVMQRLPA